MIRTLSRKRRGVATFTAIAMVATLGVAFAAMAALFAHQAKRTRAVQEETQLRQLLLAGAVAAQAGMTGEVETPVADGRLWVEPSEGAVTVRGQVGARRAEQVLTLEQGRVVAAELR